MPSDSSPGPHGPDLCVGQHTGVDSAFDFRTGVPHGPSAVRVLIYRLCESVSEFNRRSAIHLDGAAATKFQENLWPPCDPATA